MIDTQHRTTVLKRLRDINDSAAANYYFDLIAELIQRYNIGSDDLRISLNTRNESNKRRFSANINGRLVAGLQTTPDGNRLLLALYQSDFNSLRAEMPSLEQHGEKFRDEEPQALLVDVSIAVVRTQDATPLISAWHRHIEAYLPRQQASQYRKHHTPLLYGMVIDKEVREAVFKEAAMSIVREAMPSRDFDGSIDKRQLQQTQAPLNTILYGPPGTGKTYSTLAKALAIASPNFDLNNSARDVVRAEFDRLRTLGQI